MLILYGVPTSQPVRAVAWLLLMKREPFELRIALPQNQGRFRVNGDRSPDSDLARMNPRNTMPCIDDGGFVLWESHAIMVSDCRPYGPAPFICILQIYLCETRNWTDLLPSDARRRAIVHQYLVSE